MAILNYTMFPHCFQIFTDGFSNSDVGTHLGVNTFLGSTCYVHIVLLSLAETLELLCGLCYGKPMVFEKEIKRAVTITNKVERGSAWERPRDSHPSSTRSITQLSIQSLNKAPVMCPAVC